MKIPLPCIRRSLVLFLFILTISVGVDVRAQKPVERTYMIEFSGLDDRSDEKVVLAALIDQDPNALISIALVTHKAKVRTVAELDRSALQNTITSYGIAVVRFNQLVTVPMEHPDRQAVGLDAQGEEAYRQQKLQWMDEHPGVPFPATEQQVPHEH